MPRTMSELTREETIQRLDELLMRLRDNAHEGHMPYVVDALEMIVRLIADEQRGDQNGPAGNT